jgi:hypothetical protein
MRFFSNDNRETTDDSSNVDVQARAEELNADQAHDDHPERVQSDPVAVPQQRSGSPWSDAPAAGYDNSERTAEGTDRVDEADDTTDRADDTTDRDEDGADRDEDGPDRVEDSAHTDRADGVPAAATEHDERDERDGVDVPLDEPGTEPGTETDRLATDDERHVPDDAVRDEGDFDAPEAVDPGSGEPLAEARDDDARDDDEDSEGEPVDQDGAAVGSVFGDDGPDEGKPVGHDEPTYDDLEKGKPVGHEPLAPPADSEPSIVPVPVPVPVPVGGAAAAGVPTATPASGTADDRVADESPATPLAEANAATPKPAEEASTEEKKPGSVGESELATLFAGPDAQSFRDRWRDVQLRFVDSPKDATTEAATLLDEAVEKLAAGLRAQKASLAGQTSDDTEHLRVELRGYRDLLNRILGL